MPDFAEIIAESFYSETELIWKLNSQTHAIAAFEVKSIRVEVDFEQREKEGPWHVGFNTASGDLVDRTNMTLAFRIFNGVFQAVREFIDTREPEMVAFIAKDEDLAGIYGTYLWREKPTIQKMGYTLEGPRRIEPYTEWTLRRSKPSAWRQ
jgi:hypothetical protein